MSKPPNEPTAPSLAGATTSDPSVESTIGHMAEEFAELEGKGRPHWLRALVVILLIGAGAVGVWSWLQRGKARRATPVAVVGVPIDVRQPRQGSVLDAPPTFVWESVIGRHDYAFTLKRDDAATPVVERVLTSSSLSLPPDEAAKLAPGSYVWIVHARSIDGAVVGTGSGRFRMR